MSFDDFFVFLSAEELQRNVTFLYQKQLVLVKAKVSESFLLVELFIVFEFSEQLQELETVNFYYWITLSFYQLHESAQNYILRALKCTFKKIHEMKHFWQTEERRSFID